MNEFIETRGNYCARRAGVDARIGKICWLIFNAMFSRPYVCNDCGKAFTQVTNLNNHTRLHTGEVSFRKNAIWLVGWLPILFVVQQKSFLFLQRPFVCIEANCGRSFAQVTNLNNHMKTHHKIQQYVCNQCPKKFTQVRDRDLFTYRSCMRMEKCGEFRFVFFNFLKSKAFSIIDCLTSVIFSWKFAHEGQAGTVLYTRNGMDVLVFLWGLPHSYTNKGGSL